MAVTTVADNASSVTLLASNGSRKSAEIYNDSTATLYVRCEVAAASAAAYTAKMAAGSYFVVPFGYTGEIRGIWSSADGGYARITEG